MSSQNTAASSVQKGKKMRYPVFQKVGDAVLHDGNKVVIMTPYQWNKYCHDFNQLNDIPQPKPLLDEMQRLKQEDNERQAKVEDKQREIRYKSSWTGKTNGTVRMWYRLLIPLLIVLFLYEDIGNRDSPRRMMWKQRLQIPDLQDYIMFEIANAASQQTQLSEQAKAEREKKQMEREAMIKAGTLPPEEGIIDQNNSTSSQDEEEDDVEGNSENVDDENYQADQYYANLQPIVYGSKAEAMNVTFKQFMSNNIRKHLPAGYNALVKDWVAFKKWRDPRYLLDQIGEEYVEAIGFQKMEPYANYANLPDAMMQRGAFVKFGDYFQRYMEKFEDPQLEVKFDIVNMIYQMPIPDQLKADFYEPRALNLALELDYTTMNVMSQGAQTMTKYEVEDILHCVVTSGAGERVTLVSPYQRPGIQPGQLKRFKGENDQEMEAFIPPNYSFRDITAEVVSTNENDIRFLKPIHVDLIPGDCVHIPSYWWYQIRVNVDTPPPEVRGEEKHDRTDRTKDLTLSVDFWYEKQSYWLENMFHGMEVNKLN